MVFALLTALLCSCQRFTATPETAALVEPAAPAPPPPAAPPAAPPPEMTVTKGEIGAGTPYASPWWRLSAPIAGPSVLVEAGIHGDEIAGVIALDNLLPRLAVTRGTVVVLPRMNRPAVDAERRFIEVDLNMVFPGDSAAKGYERRLAAELFSWVGEMDVDVVVTLHESRYLHDGTDGRTFGQTIVYGVKPMPELLGRVLARLNREVAEERERFWPNYYPIATSSTEQFVAKWGVEGFCAETWRGLSLERRVALQEELVLAFLDEAGVGYELRPPVASAAAPGAGL